MKEHYTVYEVAKLTNIPRSTLRHAVAIGKVPTAWKDGKPVFTSDQIPAVHEYAKTRHLTVTAWGETKTIKKWSLDPRCKVKIGTIYNRLLFGCWTPEDILTVPIHQKPVKYPCNTPYQCRD
jgi:hypothetical protein